VIELAHHADIAILRMVHGKANAMSTEFCRSLTAHLEDLRTAPTRAVVLTGTGRMFSAGVDLPRLLDGGAPYIREFLPALNTMLATVFAYPKPVIAAVNGHAIAGGCVLACAADRRLMAKEGGRIGVTELLVGVPYPAAAMEIMRHAMAPQYFEHAIFSGATFTADEAALRGMVDEVVEPEHLPGRALSAAMALAALSPEAFALSKRQTRQPCLDRLERDGPRIDDAVTQIWCAHDTLERISDYVTRTLKKG
jgi:enoyl-CoA hydratase